MQDKQAVHLCHAPWSVLDRNILVLLLCGAALRLQLQVQRPSDRKVVQLPPAQLLLHNRHKAQPWLHLVLEDSEGLWLERVGGMGGRKQESISQMRNSDTVKYRFDTQLPCSTMTKK